MWIKMLIVALWSFCNILGQIMQSAGTKVLKKDPQASIITSHPPQLTIHISLTKAVRTKGKRRLNLAHAFFIVCYCSLIIGGLQRIYFSMRLFLNLFLRYSFIDGYCDGSVFSFCFIPGFIMSQEITA